MNKKSLSEEDIKMRYITKAIQLKHWRDEQIRMEVPITAGQVRIKGNLRTQGRPKRADYLLYGKDGMPLAVVEAKDNTHLISFGMQQAKTYAQMMDLKFAYSSNGDGFQEFDFLTGKEQTLTLSEFPTEMELLQRIKEEANGGSGLSEAERKIIAQPYYTGPKTFAPRYYQRVAVDRTVEAYARGEKRLLLVMATGTGKTYTAFQIVYRLLKAGLIHKVLYLADRNVLIDQTIEGDFYPLVKEGLHKVNYAKDKVERTKLTASAVYFSLYQQLISEKSGSKNCLIRIFLISLSWTNVIAARQKKTASGGPFCPISIARRSLA